MTGRLREVWMLPLGLLLAQGAWAQTVRVPTGDGRVVMTDGILDPEEWGDADRISIGESAHLHLKEYGGYVFIGVDCGEQLWRAIICQARISALLSWS